MSKERREMIARTALEDIRDYLDAPGYTVVTRLSNIADVVAEAEQRMAKDLADEEPTR